MCFCFYMISNKNSLHMTRTRYGSWGLRIFLTGFCGEICHCGGRSLFTGCANGAVECVREPLGRWSCYRLSVRDAQLSVLQNQIGIGTYGSVMPQCRRFTHGSPSLLLFIFYAMRCKQYVRSGLGFEKCKFSHRLVNPLAS